PPTNDDKENATSEAAPKASKETLEAAARAGVEAAQLAASTSRRTFRQIEGTRVLWVDDVPRNNDHVRMALEIIGVRFVISTSTEDALDKLKTQKFDAIISDMGRPPDPRAGYTLLSRLRSFGDLTPFIIYARGGGSPENQAEAKSKGAIGSTNRPTDLYEM